MKESVEDVANSAERGLLPESWRVQQIPSELADSFVGALHPAGPALGNKLSVGLFKEGELSGVAQISSPTDPVVKNVYTRELVRVVFVDVADTWTFADLVDLYIEKRNPADIFVSLETPGVEYLSSCGFTEVDHSFERGGLEWFNSNVAFYTYKLTTEESSKYYYGVKSIKKNFGALKIDDCLGDGYLGSGKSPHFIRWREKYLPKLKKSVLSLHRSKKEAYLAEAALISDLWKTDPNCLNASNGGSDGGLLTELVVIEEKDCPVHGDTKHIGAMCYKCRDSALSERECPIHGKTLHMGRKTCLKCKAEGLFSERRCGSHGVTVFRGSECAKCRVRRLYKDGRCPKHGVTIHRAGVCSTCTAESSITVKDCPEHGERVKFQGSTCMSCHNVASLSVKSCAIHGETTHIGNSCRKCSATAAISTQECVAHGFVKHLGGRCCSCHAAKAIATNYCSSHGMTKFRGGSCLKCAASRVYSTRECKKHGVVKFRGKSCQVCIGEKVRHGKAHKTVSSPDCEFCV